jgi:hypothetical protein
MTARTSFGGDPRMHEMFDRADPEAFHDGGLAHESKHGCGFAHCSGDHRVEDVKGSQ